MAGASSGGCWRSVVGTNPPFHGRGAPPRHGTEGPGRIPKGCGGGKGSGSGVGAPLLAPRVLPDPEQPPCPCSLSLHACRSLFASSWSRGGAVQPLAAGGRWFAGVRPHPKPPPVSLSPSPLAKQDSRAPRKWFCNACRKQQPGSRATLPQGGSFQHPLCAPLGAEGAGETEAGGQEVAGAQNGEKTGFLALPLALPAGEGCSLPLRAGTAPARAPLFPLGFSAFPRSEDTPGPAATSPRGSFRFSPPPGCRLLGERGDCSPPGGVRQAPALCVAGLRGWLWPPARPRALCQRQLLAGTAWLPAPRQPCSLGRMAGCVRQHPGLLPRLSRVRSAPTLKAESPGGSSEGLRRGQKSPWGGTRWLHPCASHASALKAPGFPPCFPLPVNIGGFGGTGGSPCAPQRV